MTQKVGYAKRECADRGKIEGLLESARVGILGLSDGGMPYAVPVNFVWFDNALYFHGLGSGRKFSLLEKSPPVCFTVYRERGTVSDPVPCHADTSYLSVMLFGVAERLSDAGHCAAPLGAFIEKYAPGFYARKIDANLISRYRSSLDGNAVAVYRIAPTEITAKENSEEPDSRFATRA